MTEFTLTPYNQTFWVDAQYYNNAWPELVDLWRLYNRHLVPVISHLPADKVNIPCIIDASTAETVTLGFLVEDYLVHLRHHLEQIEQRMNG